MCISLIRQAIEIILKKSYRNCCYIKKSGEKWRMKLSNPIRTTDLERKRIMKLSIHILDVIFLDGQYPEIVIIFDCPPSSINKLNYKPRKSKT